MTTTIPDQAPIAGQVERLRELVLDLGQAVTRLTTDLAVLRGQVGEIGKAEEIVRRALNGSRPAGRSGDRHGLHVIQDGAR